jgi:hypothetical protein
VENGQKRPDYRQAKGKITMDRKKFLKNLVAGSVAVAASPAIAASLIQPKSGFVRPEPTLLIPRMPSYPANPVDGTMFFCTDKRKILMFHAGQWWKVVDSKPESEENHD